MCWSYPGNEEGKERGRTITGTGNGTCKDTKVKAPAMWKDRTEPGAAGTESSRRTVLENTLEREARARSSRAL